MSEPLLAAALRRVIDKRRVYDEIDRKHKRAKAAKKAAEIAAAELMDDLKTPSHTVDLGPGYGTFRCVPRHTKFGQILDKETARESLERLGREEELFRREPAKGRINEFVREEIEAGRPLPDGIGYYEHTGVTMTRKT